MISKFSNFCWIEFSVKRPNYFRRNIFIKVDELEKTRQLYENTGVFATAYRYLSPKCEGPIYAPYMYFDLDHPGLIEKSPAAWKDVRSDYLAVLARLDTYYGIKREYTRAYFSGLKGISILVPSICFGLGPNDKLNKAFYAIAEDIANLLSYWPIKTLDLAIYDRVRLWRLINSRHEVSGLFKIPLSFRSIMSLDLQSILKMAEMPRPDSEPVKFMFSAMARIRVKDLLTRHNDRPPKGNSLDFEPPCIAYLLEDKNVGVGYRNNTLTALASYYFQRGLEQTQVLNLLRDFNKKQCVPSLPDREIDSIVRSVFRHGYTFGCRAFRELSICKPEECRIGKHIDSKQTAVVRRR